MREEHKLNRGCVRQDKSHRYGCSMYSVTQTQCARAGLMIFFFSWIFPVSFYNITVKNMFHFAITLILQVTKLAASWLSKGEAEVCAVNANSDLLSQQEEDKMWSQGGYWLSSDVASLWVCLVLEGRWNVSTKGVIRVCCFFSLFFVCLSAVI